ncbi:MAG: hypothetical protein KHY76_05120 [Butyricicoccus pullicaecorum]|nr:hypothetical protein [Butyricicoccus pullicaecorum]
MKVKKRTLLLLAALVWGIAGFNILRIGILSYVGYAGVVNFLLSVVVFLLFQTFVFGPLVRRHTIRILGYSQEKQLFLKFFDRKSFLIMAFMMTFGIGLRASGLAPVRFIAVFYTGLGAALFLAGLLFGKNYFVKRFESEVIG